MSKMIVSDNISLTLNSDICVAQHLSYQAGFLADLHPHLRVDQMLLREEHMYPDTVYSSFSTSLLSSRGERGNVGNPLVLHQWYCPMGCTNFFHSTSLTSYFSFPYVACPKHISHICPHFSMSVLMTITKCSN